MSKCWSRYYVVTKNFGADKLVMIYREPSGMFYVYVYSSIWNSFPQVTALITFTYRLKKGIMIQAQLLYIKWEWVG